MSNSEKHPDAWEFFIENARNMEKEEEVIYGKYRIPHPCSTLGDIRFIYANDSGELWSKFIEEWYKPDLNSQSAYGKIQAIVEKFK